MDHEETAPTFYGSRVYVRPVAAPPGHTGWTDIGTVAYPVESLTFDVVPIGDPTEAVHILSTTQEVTLEFTMDEEGGRALRALLFPPAPWWTRAWNAVVARTAYAVARAAARAWRALEVAVGSARTRM